MLKENILNLKCCYMSDNLLRPLILSWLLLLVVLQTLDSTGKYIKGCACPAYICAFLACHWNSLQIKYLFTRGIFISVSLRLMLLLGVVRTV